MPENVIFITSKWQILTNFIIFPFLFRPEKPKVLLEIHIFSVLISIIGFGAVFCGFGAILSGRR